MPDTGGGGVGGGGGGSLNFFGNYLNALGSAMESSANANAAKFNADSNELNAFIALDNARVNAQRKRRLNRKALGGIQAAIGASGLTLDGSALDVLEDSAMELELDVLTILHEGKLKNMAFLAQAEQDRRQSRGIRRAGQISTVTSLFGG